jgi:hypothetical protein
VSTPPTGTVTFLFTVLAELDAALSEFEVGDA